MALTTTNAGLGEYRKMQAGGSLTDASPHRVVQIMLQTALDRLSEAKGRMERGDVATKAESISKALGIIEGLQLNLDRDRGREVAENLDGLYEYMSRTLLRANLENRPELLDEVADLLLAIKSGWDAIAAVE